MLKEIMVAAILAISMAGCDGAWAQLKPRSSEANDSAVLNKRNRRDPEVRMASPSLVTMFCVTADDSKTIKILATNSSTQAFSCSSTCKYRDNGVAGELSCTGTVPSKANVALFCSRTSSTSQFTVSDPGYNDCP